MGLDPAPGQAAIERLPVRTAAVGGTPGGRGGAGFGCRRHWLSRKMRIRIRNYYFLVWAPVGRTFFSQRVLIVFVKNVVRHQCPCTTVHRVHNAIFPVRNGRAPSPDCHLMSPSNRRWFPSNRSRLPSQRRRVPSNRRRLLCNRCLIACLNLEPATGRPDFCFR